MDSIRTAATVVVVVVVVVVELQRQQRFVVGCGNVLVATLAKEVVAAILQRMDRYGFHC